MSDLPPKDSDRAEDFDGEDLTAGEYALGVLGKAERETAEARMAREPAFARTVEAWEEKLYPMADGIADVPAPPQVWPRIVAGLGATTAAVSNVVDLAQRRALSFWRNWAFAASAAAAVALVFLAVRPSTFQPPVTPAPTPAVQPLLVAELTDPKGNGAVTATYDQVSGVLHVSPSLALAVGEERAAELWLIPADGVPRSLGVIDQAHMSTVKLTDPLRPGAKVSAVLAITSEQPGGSPTGKPTTTPKWVGKLTAA